MAERSVKPAAGLPRSGEPPASVSPSHALWRRLRRHRLAMSGGIAVLVVGVLGLAAPVLLRADPTALDVEGILKPPSATHWLGTDDFGRDLLSRILHGTRLSLAVGSSTLVFTVCVGGFSGLISGYFRVADAVIMRIMDALMAFPAILLALAVMAIAGPATVNVVVALGIAYSPRMARLTRAGVLTVRTRDYIEAVRALGARQMRIVWRHVVPNALAPLIVQGTFTFAAAILGEAALSFVGLGTVPPAPSLGNILADARPVIRDAPWMIVFPSVTLSVTILGLNLFGDGLRDVLDPRMRI